MSLMEISNQINLHPNNLTHVDNLEVVNHSRFLIQMIFNSAEREILYTYQNDQGERKSSNILPALAIRKVEILNSGNGIQFAYFMQ